MLLDVTTLPAFQEVLWDFHTNLIEDKTVFQLYERRWRYIDQSKITPYEQETIEKLTKEFGNGFFMPC